MSQFTGRNLANVCKISISLSTFDVKQVQQGYRIKRIVPVDTHRPALMHFDKLIGYEKAKAGLSQVTIAGYFLKSIRAQAQGKQSTISRAPERAFSAFFDFS